MSTFEPIVQTCTECGTDFEVDRVTSVNVDRMPEHRDGVLQRTFQQSTCPECGAESRIPPTATYVDLARGNWIRVEDATTFDDRDHHEARTRQLFTLAYGPAAPPLVQAMGADLRPRLVYGWPALREKLVCDDLGLEDATVELLKAAILRTVADAPVGGPSALRLASGDADELVFHVIDDHTEDVTSTLPVPRSVYDDVRSDTEAWGPLREDLDASYLVDVTRFMR